MNAVQKLVDQIVKRDRLPMDNSYEAQQCLRDAWNTIDVCQYNAISYKHISRVTYIICLLLGTLIIALSVLQVPARACGEQMICADRGGTIERGEWDAALTRLGLGLSPMQLSELWAGRVQPNSTNTESLSDEDLTEDSFALSTAIFLTASLLTILSGMNTFMDPSRRYRKNRDLPLFFLPTHGRSWVFSGGVSCGPPPRT